MKYPLDPFPHRPAPRCVDGGARRLCLGLGAAAFAWPASLLAQPAGTPVRIGVDAEFGLDKSTSAQAIELGLRIAISEINASGGVLRGRPLELLVRDNRSVPARAIANLRELSSQADLVAVFGGKFSPVMIDAVPVVQELKLPLLAVWSSADSIIENPHRPNYVFRLALRDGLAMPKLLDTARARGHRKVGLFLANTGWGRSNLAAGERHLAATHRVELAGVAWHNWGEKSFIQRYRDLLSSGAQAVLAVANDDDAAVLVREVAALPAAERVPLVFHQGITGGRFVQLCGPALHALDVSVLQTFSFFRSESASLRRFMRAAHAVDPALSIERIEAPTGVAHAYDMLHILAKAVNRAGSTDRVAVRDALEQVPEHRGLIKHYQPPFSAGRHEALGPGELLIARYRADGVLVPDEG